MKIKIIGPEDELSFFSRSSYIFEADNRKYGNLCLTVIDPEENIITDHVFHPYRIELTDETVVIKHSGLSEDTDMFWDIYQTVSNELDKANFIDVFEQYHGKLLAYSDDLLTDISVDDYDPDQCSSIIYVLTGEPCDDRGYKCIDDRTKKMKWRRKTPSPSN